MVATNDAHFLTAADHDAHDVLLCIGLGKDQQTTPTGCATTAGLYYKSAPEIAAHFPDRPDVLDERARDCRSGRASSSRRRYHLPSFPLPDTHRDENEYLVHLATGGAERRYGSPLPARVQERLDYELEVIKGTGYAGYFLITWDFIDWARRQGIPVGPGRGSAAGSLVAYALGITNLCPLEHDLLFERFLNPERVSMPDIDIDFCFERRAEVIEYVRGKYGKDAVGQIVTFGTMKSRAVIRDVGRTLGFEPVETDRIAKLIPNAPQQSFTVEEAVSQLREVKNLYERDERHRQLFDYSMTLEGLSRHASVHAAGVVIAPGPLDEYVPTCIQVGKNGATQGYDEEVMAVTQYDMNCLDEAGMLKMDFLGLKTLTVIHDAVGAVRQRIGTLRHPVSGAVYASMDEVPLDDPAVYRMLARGGTSGVFQFESSLAIDKLRAMKCDRFDDLVAANALIRPGPLDSGMTDVYIRRKLGQEPVTYPHPNLQKVLEPTYGIIVYQEQVMRIANILAGYTLGEADILRKAVGKKDVELIKQELGRFIRRVVQRGVDRRLAEDLADQIETFGRYGFNKSHSVAYSLISYHTAWLKAYYPAEFMASMLSAVLDKTDDVVKYIAECRDITRCLPDLEQAIEVLPPDVNESGWKFTAVGNHQIRFGLGAVRGVGNAAVGSALSARAEGGRFISLFDFLERIDTRALNKRACEALIAAGALDPCGVRAQLLAALDLAYQEAQAREAERESGQESLFGDTSAARRKDPVLPEVPEWDEAEQLVREKEALGFFISGHPLERFREVVGAFDRVNTATLKEHVGEKVELACVVTSVARQISRRDASEWGKVVVEDFVGTAMVLAFKEAWHSARATLKQDAPVLLRGMVSNRERDEGDPPIFLDGVELLEALPATGRLAVQISLQPDIDLAHDALTRVREVLIGHPGPAPVELVFGNGGDARFRSRTLTVSVAKGTLEELRAVLGHNRVRVARVGEPGTALGVREER